MAARSRILFITIAFVVLFVSAVGRLFYLQVIKGAYYKSKALSQQGVSEQILPERGNIYLTTLAGETKSGQVERKDVPIALTRTWYNVWISPKEITPESQEAVVKNLAAVLGLEEKNVRERVFKTDDPYEPLKDKVDKKVIEALEKLNYRGVHWNPFQDRYYPLGEFASQVTGFVSRTNPDGSTTDIKNGQYGLEGFFNSKLKGESGYIAGFKKALGSLILPLSRITKPKKGEDIYLTLDYNIQMTVEKELKKTAEKFNAEGASAIVINPKTGAIMAMAVWPNFDPNKYNEVKNASTFMNSNVQLVFEPGSIFKPITMASALDINVVSPDLKYYDSGEVKVSGFTIRNSTLQSWGEQTMTQVLEKSLNTGVIFVLRRMPQGVWREYVNNFGFAEKTGITLSGEAKGDLSNLKSGIEVDWVTSAFGQGISVTPLAMTNAIAAIANGGELLAPYIISKITAGDEVVFTGERMVKRRVIKPETSKTLTGMLVNVVENGSGKQARIPGYSVAGKTGTAQVAAPSGGYTDKTIHTFVGYSPAYDPAFLMLIKLDNPQGIRFSEGSAAPMFKNVGEFILHYLEVPPDKAITK